VACAHRNGLWRWAAACKGAALGCSVLLPGTSPCRPPCIMPCPPKPAGLPGTATREGLGEAGAAARGRVWGTGGELSKLLRCWEASFRARTCAHMGMYAAEHQCTGTCAAGRPSLGHTEQMLVKQVYPCTHRPTHAHMHTHLGFANVCAFELRRALLHKASAT